MKIIHDSRNARYRSPFGAAETGTEIRLAVDIADADVVEAVLQYRRDEEPVYQPVHMVEETAGDERAGSGQEPDDTVPGGVTHRLAAVIKAPEESCLLWYRFKLILKDEDGIRSLFYCNNADGYGGRGQIIDSSGELIPYQITVYKRSETPEWYKNGIVYQIFPDRFDRDEDWLDRCEKANRSVNGRRNDMQRVIEKDWYKPAYYVRDSAKRVVKWPIYGGSLRGIMGRLEYLRSLGVTVIYLNPVFEASTNHRYDTGNYMKIDPALGTDQDFIDLAEAAGKRGIRLILDGVFSHTGSDSIYFDKYGNYPHDGSFSSEIHGAWGHEDSPFRSWYKFDPEEKWGYKSWWGVEDLPEVIEEDPAYREYILGSKAAAADDKSRSSSRKGSGSLTEGVVPHWLKLGASGWRLDVADELPDEFIRGVKTAIKDTDPEGLLIGEVWEDASNKVSYGERRKYFAGDELDGTMNYPFRAILLDYINYTITAEEAGRRFMSLAENYPRENLYGALNLIGSHDRARILTLMAADKDRQSAVSKVKLLSALEYALPGVPCIYYGDEAGLEGAADPENRSGFPWGGEDHELQFHYRMLSVIYNEHPVLKDGDIIMLSGDAGSNSGSSCGGRANCENSEKPADTQTSTNIPGDVLAFIRVNADERILVLVNRSYGRNEVDLSGIEDVRCGYAIDLLTSVELKPDKPLALEPLSMKMILMLDEPPVREHLDRSAGVICHVGSLGDQALGKKGRDFVDYIAGVGFSIWQVLPVNPAGAGGSPYDSVSAFAGDPAMIDLSEVPDDSGLKVFCDKNAFWLHGYAAYVAIKEKLGGMALMDWPDEYRLADPEESFRAAKKESPDLVSRVMHEQYWFASEWNALREYAHSRGVKIMGDLPIYMSADSADLWTNRSIFRMDENGRLSVHSGVPPDYFSSHGQNWGNPLYDWDELKKDNYGWWCRRIRQCAERYDILRIDHFRAFSEYWAIPEDMQPVDGTWQLGPGRDFIRTIKTMLTEEGFGMKLLAEDLGQLDACVYDLLKLSGLPGMDVWQFSSFEMMEQPEEVAKQRAFYTGTHDNSTLAGFVMEHADEIMGSSTAGHYDKSAVEAAAKDIIRKIYESPAILAMMQLQDVFMLDDSARMNDPRVSEGNWEWRIPGSSIKASFPDAEARAAWLHDLAEKTNRI
ncbi:MAG: 4-alpha-glucanotransferase [Eubacterium sp.]|nr:4-alpha-glucanotransferase [Eubacterium sp.]